MTQRPSVPLFQSALIGLYRTDQDAGLLAYAGMLARNQVIGAMHFVHVLPDSAPSPESAQDAATLAEMKTQASKHLADLPAAIVWKHALLRGPLIDRLLDYAQAEKIDLLLVGHRQDHPMRRSLARRLAKLAPSSVLLVPEGAAAAITRVLTPIDFSPSAADALRVAVKLGALVGLKDLTALHVYFDEARTTYEGADESIRGDEAAHFDAFVAPIEKLGVNIETLFRQGLHPAHTIRKVADERAIDLIVMETRGRTTSAAILLGSVTEETLAESRVPVLVVKHPGTQIGLLRALLLKLFRSEPGLQYD